MPTGAHLKRIAVVLLAAAPLTALGMTIPAMPDQGRVAASPTPGPARSVDLADPAVPPAELGPIPVALLVDLGSGQMLYAKEPNRRFVPASITKVMTLYVAFELLSRGQIKPAQVFRMSQEAYRNWHAIGSTMFLDRAHDVSVHELLMGIANVSANDGCVVLAEGAAGSVPNWVALMNAEARRLGMKDSHFGTPNGWMDEGQTYVSARDLATLAQAMLIRHPEFYHTYIGHPTMTWNGITQRNHDPILGKLEGADGIKTGFTNQAGYGFLGSAIRNGRRLIMVIGGAYTPKDRAHAAEALMNWGFAAFDSRPLFAPGTAVGEAQVQGGEARRVALVAPDAISAASPRGTRTPVHLRIVYDGPLEAPIRRGDLVAQLEIGVGDQPPHRVPLAAAADVPRASLMARLRNGLLGLFG